MGTPVGGVTTKQQPLCFKPDKLDGKKDLNESLKGEKSEIMLFQKGTLSGVNHTEISPVASTKAVVHSPIVREKVTATAASGLSTTSAFESAKNIDSKGQAVVQNSIWNNQEKGQIIVAATESGSPSENTGKESRYVQHQKTLEEIRFEVANLDGGNQNIFIA